MEFESALKEINDSKGKSLIKHLAEIEQNIVGMDEKGISEFSYQSALTKSFLMLLYTLSKWAVRLKS